MISTMIVSFCTITPVFYSTIILVPPFSPPLSSPIPFAPQCPPVLPESQYEYLPFEKLGFEVLENYFRPVVGPGVEHPDVNYESQGVEPGDHIEDVTQDVID